ncbi:MAG: hypothetical protein A3H59_00565 [Candidatus Jacksonbacteria bacterium RIFCSPLOWO2_02_FULL_43_9]|nr:MAG: hypothetical protein A3B94_02625 [Candidatus Jacksonbacteria bacterium RIFCSPHIGHO2_02_FULL_43_10]OGY70951.1 MAG: hypothetical protein A2986_01450 [Candidatus Jacksonbacteria bacterium RIFCSPLOWO2_01_FULL_44_13]OGY71814.1 MAG: hypothetical protein A3H59_00565 [Candidatus Jacksonbacteria bacterium RIFCSPLOWO2_02_FULL_43_9]HAZ16470.1 hypothetical protein [Candidatus Jacksonbacteria bacterium]
MYSNELFQKVKEMQLPVGKYALFGSAPLAIRGIRECRDIDMIVSKDVWEEYKHKGWEMAVAPHGSEYLLRDEIEMWKDWYPGEWDVSDLIAKAEIIDGLPCVILDTVIEWKKLKGRDQDIRDIELIEEFLKK